MGPVALAAAAFAATVAAGPALAQNPPAAAWVTLGDAEFYGASLRALVILFVLAILIESALAVIFNWRLYLTLFSGRGVNTLVMIAVSALAVWTFNIDVVHTMLTQFGLGTPAPTTLSRFLTALILAGGSAGVYRLLVALGYREERRPEEVRPKPKKEKAWIAVRTERDKAVGPIYVRITEVGPAAPNGPGQLAGVITTEGFWRTVWSVFFLDRTRFPPTGGYEVETAKQYRLEVTAADAEGQKLEAGINGVYSFADGAIIDFKTKL